MQIEEKLNLTSTTSSLVCSIHFPDNSYLSVEESNVIVAVMCFYCSSCEAQQYQWISHRCMESLKELGGL